MFSEYGFKVCCSCNGSGSPLQLRKWQASFFFLVKSKNNLALPHSDSILLGMSTLLIQNGLVVDSQQSRHADILVEGSKIVRIEPNIDVTTLPADTDIIHADDLCVLPGIIDAHTHYHLVSRGTVTADSFLEGSRVAAYGGVTTIIDFADHNKAKTLAASATDRLKEMSPLAIDYALHQGVYEMRESIPTELEELKAMGIRAIKVFTTYRNIGYLIEREEELTKLFAACRDLDLLVCVHCEDNALLEDIAAGWKGTYKASDHPDLRTAEVEAKGISYVGTIAKKLNMPLYVVHLSSKQGLEAVRSLRKEGANIIVETTAHYLFLDRTKLEGEEGALYLMTPPLRTKDDNEALQEALAQGEIQVVATDHCAFTAKAKLASSDCRVTLPGIPGSEEMLALLNTFVLSGGRMNMQDMVSVLSTNPAKIFGLYPQKGSLEIGTDADLVLFDPDETWVIDKENTHSAAGYTAYEGFHVSGKVVMTYLRGRLIMGDHVYLGIPGDGRFVPAGEPLPYRKEGN